MKGNELRFGNLIFWEGELYEVKRSFFDQYSDDEIEPIPLTEEWLLRFGIERDSYDRRKFHFLGVKIYIFPDGRIVFNPESSSIYIELEYVHTLQNLYFLFKNEELTLKE